MAKFILEDGKKFEGTPEEIIEFIDKASEKWPAEAQKEVEAKWAEIGRKPNEFKKGDIVRVVANFGARLVKVGDVVEVKSSCRKKQVFDSNHGYSLEAELIAPVEARFDC